MYYARDTITLPPASVHASKLEIKQSAIDKLKPNLDNARTCMEVLHCSVNLTNCFHSPAIIHNVTHYRI